jgi:hypothetical protein
VSIVADACIEAAAPVAESSGDFVCFATQLPRMASTVDIGIVLLVCCSFLTIVSARDRFY